MGEDRNRDEQRMLRSQPGNYLLAAARGRAGESSDNNDLPQIEIRDNYLLAAAGGRAGESAAGNGPGRSSGNNLPQIEIRGNTLQVVATPASTLLLPADPKRKFMYLVNNDTLGYAIISFGVDATLATGMKLAAGGGGIILDNNVPTAAVYIIGSIAMNSNITMVVA